MRNARINGDLEIGGLKSDVAPLPDGSVRRLPVLLSPAFHSRTGAPPGTFAPPPVAASVDVRDQPPGPRHVLPIRATELADQHGRLSPNGLLSSGFFQTTARQVMS